MTSARLAAAETRTSWRCAGTATTAASTKAAVAAHFSMGSMYLLKRPAPQWVSGLGGNDSGRFCAGLLSLTAARLAAFDGWPRIRLSGLQEAVADHGGFNESLRQPDVEREQAFRSGVAGLVGLRHTGQGNAPMRSGAVQYRTAERKLFTALDGRSFQQAGECRLGIFGDGQTFLFRAALLRLLLGFGHDPSGAKLKSAPAGVRTRTTWMVTRVQGGPVCQFQHGGTKGRSSKRRQSGLWSVWAVLRHRSFPVWSAQSQRLSLRLGRRLKKVDWVFIDRFTGSDQDAQQLVSSRSHREGCFLVLPPRDSFRSYAHHKGEISTRVAEPLPQVPDLLRGEGGWTLDNGAGDHLVQRFHAWDRYLPLATVWTGSHNDTDKSHARQAGLRVAMRTSHGLHRSAAVHALHRCFFLHVVTTVSSVSDLNATTTHSRFVWTRYLQVPFSRSAGSRTAPARRTFMQSSVSRLSAAISRNAWSRHAIWPSRAIAWISAVAASGLSGSFKTIPPNDLTYYHYLTYCQVHGQAHIAGPKCPKARSRQRASGRRVFGTTALGRRTRLSALRRCRRLHDDWERRTTKQGLPLALQGL